jgi:hypothetical protein
MNATKVAAALRALADAFEAVETDAPSPGNPPDGAPTPAGAPTAAPAPRGRGRPPKAAPEAPVAAPAAAPDPFDVAPAPPAVSLADVRGALTRLKDATDQATALGVLKSAGGADNLSGLSADKYGAVTAAATAALPQQGKPVPEVDPFETEAAKEPAKTLTKEDVKAAAVAAQKRTSQDTVMKVVMDHGGKVATAGGFGPSLNALPVDQYASCIGALENLPKTK